MYLHSNDKDVSKLEKRRDIFDILRAAKKVSSEEARRMLRETLKNRKIFY